MPNAKKTLPEKTETIALHGRPLQSCMVGHFRVGHGCGHAEPNTADANGTWLAVRHSLTPVVDRGTGAVLRQRTRDRDRLHDGRPGACTVDAGRACRPSRVATSAGNY